MKQTEREIINDYENNIASNFANMEFLDTPHFIGTTWHKKTDSVKVIFVIDELTNAAFREFIRVKNQLCADGVIVHCDTALVHSHSLTVILNR